MFEWNDQPGIALILLLAATPSLFFVGSLRIAIFPACQGIALSGSVLVLKKFRDKLERQYSKDCTCRVVVIESILRPATAHLTDNVQILPILTSQLREATQTEQTVHVTYCKSISSA